MFPHPTNSAGARLQRLTGMCKMEYLHEFDRVNLFPEYGGAWSVSRAKAAARNLRSGGLLRGRDVLLLGRKVANAFGVGGLDWLEMEHVHQADGLGGDFRAWLLPHPSGRNHWYNDEQNVARLEELLRNIYSK